MNDVSPVRFAALCRRPQGTVAARVSTRAGAGPAAGLLAVLALLLAGATPRAAAGGPFVRLIGVGANGAWRELRLARSGPRSDASLFSGGQKLPLPHGGYVRLFPFG